MTIPLEEERPGLSSLSEGEKPGAGEDADTATDHESDRSLFYIGQTNISATNDVAGKVSGDPGYLTGS